MTPEQLSAAIRAALQSAVDAGDLDVTVPAEVRVERPRNRDHGDWSTNIALQLAKGAGIPPRELATALATHLTGVAGVKAVDVAGPGFLNITLEAASAGELARSIVEAGAAYGHSTAEAGRVVNLEFISANPTGPLHIGHTRWAALGDAMRRLLEAAGATVAAEYYINDAGAQMDKFGASVLARAAGQEPPGGRLPGRLRRRPRGRGARRSAPTCSSSTPPRPWPWPATSATSPSSPPSGAPSTSFGVHFDVWFSERSLHDGHAVEQAVARLREQGHVFDADGRGVAAHHRLRRRQGPRARARPTVRPPTSPPTPPTT